jgi:hypothetical protein
LKIPKGLQGRGEPILAFGDRVKIYLDRRFLGEEVYLGKGRIAGRIVYSLTQADYAVDVDGGENLFVGTASLKPGVRCFRIKSIKKIKNEKSM